MTALHQAIERITGKPASLVPLSYRADSAFIAAAGIPTVLYGPPGDGAHADLEWVSIDGTRTCADVLERLAADFRAESGLGSARQGDLDLVSNLTADVVNGAGDIDRGSQGLLVADLDLDDVARGRYDFDVTGHNCRPDILSPSVERSTRKAVDLGAVVGAARVIDATREG